MLLRDIHDIQIGQGPLQRLTDAGKIGISSEGQSDDRIEAQGILDQKGMSPLLIVMGYSIIHRVVRSFSPLK